MRFNQEILDITKAIKEAIPIERIYLFGSHAYGAPGNESDYDFFVVIPDDGGIRPIDAIQKAHRALISLEHTTPVDILADYKSNFDSRKQYNTLEKKIFSEGMVIYE